MTDYVYFIGNSEAVKIGYTNNLHTRLHSIRTGNPQSIELLAHFESSNVVDDEKQLHHEFRDFRMNGEWFKCNVKLDFVIKFLKSYDSNPNANHLALAYSMYLDMPTKKPDEYLCESILYGEAVLMCQGDLSQVDQTLDAIQLRNAIGFYKNWLSGLGTFEYKRFRSSVVTSKRFDIRPWIVVTSTGTVYYCPNYFLTADFLYSKRIIPVLKFKGRIRRQLELFKDVKNSAN